ncbi:L-iditol 2-dehydrogenase [Thermodesulfovibrio aggregans]|uniref:L-iditol 2-dehydrogenase n=1 Tax=Thermodesulfovibrio aggregans TaxID=86166 RepID=A0A0U9HRP7_9BACT|nr:alcohol dehydrogenase catalytic domain-containing protein [Thermodesulfovibrio aggregans]GAQ95724.1 L-iditol 2-dehydrogenase [Thermodesulfovibrio aggregans]
MKAAYLIKPNKIEIMEKPIPTIKDGEVLVRIKAALTCGTDLKAYLRGHPLIPMPGPFGHEFSGIIEDVGSSVNGFKRGDAVMLVHTAPCGNCAYCKRGLFNLCETLTKDMMLGAFSEYIVVKERVVRQNMFHKPENIDFEEAAFLEPLSCIVHGVKALSPSEEDKVLVIGTGPVGLLFLQVLKSIGVSVAVMGRNKNKIALAKTLGADRVYYSGEDPLDFTDGFGYDRVVECTGQKEIWLKSINYVRKGGTVLLFGGLKTGTEVCYDAARIHYDEITLKGAFHYNPEDVKEAAKLIQSRKLRLKELITDKFPLSEISLAFEKLSRGEGIKYLIEI